MVELQGGFLLAALHASMERIRLLGRICRALSKKPQHRTSIDVDYIMKETSACDLMTRDGPGVHKDLCLVAKIMSLGEMESFKLTGKAMYVYVLHGRVQVRTPNQAPFDPIPGPHPPLHTPSHSFSTKSTSSISGCQPGATPAAAVPSGTGSGGQLSRGVPEGGGGGTCGAGRARVSVGGVCGGARLQGVREEDIRALFESMDVDHSGAIDAEELQVALEMVGVVKGTAEVEELMRAVGAEGSGELGLEDFIQILAMQAPGGGEGVHGPWEELGRGATGATHAGEAVWGKEYRGGATFGEAAVTSGGSVLMEGLLLALDEVDLLVIESHTYDRILAHGFDGQLQAKVALLQATPVLQATLQHTAVRPLAHAAARVTLPLHSVLYEQGHAPDALTLIVQGECKVAVRVYEDRGEAPRLPDPQQQQVQQQGLVCEASSSSFTLAPQASTASFGSGASFTSGRPPLHGGARGGGRRVARRVEVAVLGCGDLCGEAAVLGTDKHATGVTVSSQQLVALRIEKAVLRRLIHPLDLQALRTLLQQREAERMARMATSSVAASSVADASARLRAPSPPAAITIHGREVAGLDEHSSARTKVSFQRWSEPEGWGGVEGVEASASSSWSLRAPNDVAARAAGAPRPPPRPHPPTAARHPSAPRDQSGGAEEVAPRSASFCGPYPSHLGVRHISEGGAPCVAGLAATPFRGTSLSGRCASPLDPTDAGPKGPGSGTWREGPTAAVTAAGAARSRAASPLPGGACSSGGSSFQLAVRAFLEQGEGEGVGGDLPVLATPMPPDTTPSCEAQGCTGGGGQQGSRGRRASSPASTDLSDPPTPPHPDAPQDQQPPRHPLAWRRHLAKVNVGSCSPKSTAFRQLAEYEHMREGGHAWAAGAGSSRAGRAHASPTPSPPLWASPSPPHASHTAGGRGRRHTPSCSFSAASPPKPPNSVSDALDPAVTRAAAPAATSVGGVFGEGGGLVYGAAAGGRSEDGREAAAAAVPPPAVTAPSARTSAGIQTLAAAVAAVAAAHVHDPPPSPSPKLPKLTLRLPLEGEGEEEVGGGGGHTPGDNLTGDMWPEQVTDLGRGGGGGTPKLVSCASPRLAPDLGAPQGPMGGGGAPGPGSPARPGAARGSALLLSPSSARAPPRAWGGGMGTSRARALALSARDSQPRWNSEALRVAVRESGGDRSRVGALYTSILRASTPSLGARAAMFGAHAVGQGGGGAGGGGVGAAAAHALRRSVGAGVYGLGQAHTHAHAGPSHLPPVLPGGLSAGAAGGPRGPGVGSLLARDPSPGRSLLWGRGSAHPHTTTTTTATAPTASPAPTTATTLTGAAPTHRGVYTGTPLVPTPLAPAATALGAAARTRPRPAS